MVADGPDPDQRQRAEINRVERVQQLCLDRENFCARIAQHMLQREAAGRGVEGHRHRAGPGAAKHKTQQFGAIAAQQRDTVARRYSGGEQGAGVTGGDTARLRERPSLAAADEERPLAMPLRLPAQHLRDGPLRGRQGFDGREVQGAATAHGWPHRRRWRQQKRQSRSRPRLHSPNSRSSALGLTARRARMSCATSPTNASSMPARNAAITALASAAGATLGGGTVWNHSFSSGPENTLTTFTPPGRSSLRSVCAADRQAASTEENTP